MIDKKIIKDACWDIFNYNFLGAGEDWVEKLDGEKEELYSGEQVSDAIQLGIEWAQKEFINSLWHDASEEPTKRKLILFETDTLSGLVDLIVWDKQDDWVIWSYKQHINKWLYVTDLFIKK